MKKKPEPKKPKPVYSNSVKRRLEIQAPEKAKTPEHGVNCMCLYCRSQRSKLDHYGR